MKKLAFLFTGIALFLSNLAPAFAKPNADEALIRLKEGNRRFMHQQSKHPNSRLDRVRLANDSNQADYAYATVLCCSDSRVPPEFLFDTGIMDLFIVRIAGNVADTDEIGSIEYGLCHVKTPLLVVLGHTKCGAVTAVAQAMEGKGHALERNIPPLVDNIFPAVERARANHPKPDEVVPIAIEENVWQSISDLLKKSAAVRDLFICGKIKIVGAIYDLATGEVRWLPSVKVAGILKKVEAMSDKETQPLTETAGHGDSATPAAHH